MRRKRRTEILINGSKEIAATMAKEILDNYDVAIIEEPNNGLIMVKVRESAQKSLFYIGEVFVTECKARINDSLGIGIVSGHDKELSNHLAVIDAAYKAALKETESWEYLLLEEERKINTEKVARMNQVLKTKVSFETMDTE
ncbi:phosphonate C-P lyase system protein PhnG [Bacillus sp. MUM 116]|uniref:phosphonate C-P lyase system protein PhnG n=1 Tax=Bacillus sp. MUM 116 TaxID=1678002 RepID=UPI0008F5A43C|nr:phosphonate C-P lyase system protein PhnG [Bacillus sp. MUM 116]OIK15126.1 phosphonate C-P lyase system protein PhnG [Bacillus sp. MUM 116]